MKTQNTQRVNYATRINASRKRVWEAMLNRDSYRIWTTPFSEGSDYEGSWEKGSRILFLDTNGQGMFSRIAENKPYEFVSIEHIGFVKDGKEDTESEGATAMAGALENYTLTESGGVTEVSVDLDIPDAYKDMFDESWPKALSKLKALCENE